MYNHVFYTIIIYEFFYTIRLRSNSLNSSSMFSLLLPSDNHKITDPQITNHISQKTIFFYGRTNYRVVGSIACPFVMGRRVVGPLAGRDSPCTKEAVEAQKSLRTVEAQKAHCWCCAVACARRVFFCAKKSMCFFSAKTHVCCIVFL